jgi:hypothetical protein
VKFNPIPFVVVALVGLTWFYVAGAREHARVQNREKSRGDQTLYMLLALEIHANRHGQHPPIVHPRNRMPLYPWYQSFFWDPRLSHWDYFYLGREQNIRLSLVLLAVLGLCFRRFTRPLVALVLLLVVAFGCFIYKAGYFQPELLFYTLFFLTFLAACHLLQSRSPGRTIALAAVTGVLAALSHLTKAAMLPFVMLLAAVHLVQVAGDLGWGSAPSRERLVRAGGRALAAAVFAACFLAVLYPYISTSKRVFGQYFYNVNSTHYVWYDSWHHAIRGTRSHDDENRMPRMPRGERPSLRKYLREHSAGQVAARLGAGFADMWRVSYRGYGYLPYVLLYAVFGCVLLATRWQAVRETLRGRGLLVGFVVLYGAGHLLLVAFYHPISDTGTARFLLAHLAPLMFAAGWLFSQPPIWSTRWRIGGRDVTLAHAHMLVLVILAIDLMFFTWPRLMTTYGGF